MKNQSPVNIGICTVSIRFVRYWCDRAGHQRLDRVDWTDHRATKNNTHNRTDIKVERCIIKLSRIEVIGRTRSIGNFT
jgi:hypothetical protein